MEIKISVQRELYHSKGARTAIPSRSHTYVGTPRNGRGTYRSQSNRPAVKYCKLPASERVIRWSSAKKICTPNARLNVTRIRNARRKAECRMRNAEASKGASK